MSLENKLVSVAENIPKVYQAGVDAFWDAYQDKGKRTNYHHAFRGYGWRYTFKPKYDMQPTAAQGMFAGWNAGRQGADIPAMLEEMGVTLDLSKAPSLAELLSSATEIVRFGIIDASSATSCYAMCSYASSLVTIEKFIVTDKITSFANAFDACRELVNITVEKGKNSDGSTNAGINANISFVACTKLSKASIESIVDSLSASASGNTLTLSAAAITSAFGGTTSSEWVALKETKTNWAIKEE